MLQQPPPSPVSGFATHAPSTHDSLVLDETEPSGRTDLFVLADWLEDHGVALPFEKLCKTLKRRRDNAIPSGGE